MDVASTLTARRNGGHDPDPERVVTDPDALDLFAHPVRRRMLARLAEEEATMGQVARAIGEPRRNLYHHMERLVDAGLAVVSREVEVGRMTMRYYRATAERFRVRVALPDESDARPKP